MSVCTVINGNRKELPGLLVQDVTNIGTSILGSSTPLVSAVGVVTVNDLD